MEDHQLLTKFMPHSMRMISVLKGKLVKLHLVTPVLTLFKTIRKECLAHQIL